jgi:RHS repeat-associated protein
MSWTTYTTVNGQILHQDKDGVGTHLIPDTLGNIIATIDEAGTVTSRTDYLPYGEVESQTGANPTPFGFVGAWGYYNDSEATTYIRARTYSPVMAAWTTSDPIWPNELAYSYPGCPLKCIDHTGHSPIVWITVAAGACMFAAFHIFRYFAHDYYANDKMGHCVAACRITHFSPECGLMSVLATEIPGVVWEIYCKIAKCNPQGDASWEDILANLKGFGCGRVTSATGEILGCWNCETCCALSYDKSLA